MGVLLLIMCNNINRNFQSVLLRIDVMKEDNGPAAQRVLDSLFELAVKLNGPANITYGIVAGILNESSKRQTIDSGILSTSVSIVCIVLT
jgi:hypothetical protein